MNNKDLPVEVVYKYLLRDFKNLKVDLGKKDSYILELEDKVRNLENIIKDRENIIKTLRLNNEKVKSVIKDYKAQLTKENLEIRRQIKEDEIYTNLIRKIKYLRSSVNSIRELRDKMLSKYGRI